MNGNLRKDAMFIIENTIKQINPEKSVIEALENFNKQAHILAIGKAAWSMANAAHKALGEKVLGGVVITKYGHSMGKIGDLSIFEAGHPVPDENSIKATDYALDYFSSLGEGDNIVFLISGGGSALFESVAEGISLEDVENISKTLLNSGADISEINTVRKRLSKVKGGKFAQICSPAKIYSLILSDVLGNDFSVIASGPAYADNSTCEQALNIISTYGIEVPDNVRHLLEKETPKAVKNAESRIIGSITMLCDTVAALAEKCGYKPYILADNMTCQAREAGSLISSMAVKAEGTNVFQKPCALIFGGETVVKVNGNGLGGRNQELALSAALGIGGNGNICIFSFGSDGTDGPTDAAGGLVDGDSLAKYEKLGYDPIAILNNNDSYTLLKAAGDLLITGPTGTNVNDVAVVLIGACEG
ncbi:glycerate kinase [Tyzzerella sp. OttesenSCG-928-J15]|nr:glycerate kinase [Tyzzerella sp. OttesenSCG-928-J15]